MLKFRLNADWGPCPSSNLREERRGRSKSAATKPPAIQERSSGHTGNPGPIQRPETAYHVENWIECIKSRKPCNADIEIGQRTTTLCHLVNIVREMGRVGEALKWDPVAERFTELRRGKQAPRPAPAQRLRVAQPRLTLENVSCKSPLSLWERGGGEGCTVQGSRSRGPPPAPPSP